MDGMLLHRLRAGEIGAFTELYNRYWEALYRSSLKRIANADDAKDLIQDLFVTIWTRKDQLPQAIDWEDYLYAALRYKVINYIQADEVRIRYANAKLAESDALHPQADSIVALGELEHLIDRAMDRMPQRIREVFRLSYAEGCSPQEIAQRLSLSLQTVKNYLADAKAIVRRFLHDYPAAVPLLLLGLAGFERFF
ncbi:RNA polymerase sigma-70 factor [Parapedobacter defluvii]|uniref:RNA polymerase sigma-70 factor n=2 Tax=Parapedobacter defluvii TaxID=2045106 RepID=A0ABQ1MGA1_9SPHI|nr:sigma-70 family RNA polymerase sigma factor [Parapedobacter defluvii]GGC40306.1 RNA polymerase sigma-70 factor [Parapedobacter defluvii]